MCLKKRLTHLEAPTVATQEEILLFVGMVQVRQKLKKEKKQGNFVCRTGDFLDDHNNNCQMNFVLLLSQFHFFLRVGTVLINFHMKNEPRGEIQHKKQHGAVRRSVQVFFLAQ